MIATFERWLILLAGGAVTLLITGWLCFQWGDASRGAKDDQFNAAADAKRSAAAVLAAQHALDLQARVDTAQSQIAAHTAQKQAVTATVTRTLIEKVPTYVTRKADSGCTITRGPVDVLNAAAAGHDLPSPSADSGSSPDAAAPGIALSDVVQSVVGNYGICHADENQIDGLQAAIKAYQAAQPRAPQ